MEDKLLPPPSLRPDQEGLCRRLDEWHRHYKLKSKPSDMFRGAIFAIRPECRSNPDYIAQAANSLREILYPFWSPQVRTVPDKKDALINYGSVLVDEALTQEIGRLYGRLNDLAHHHYKPSSDLDSSNFKEADFRQLLDDFEQVMKRALTRQFDLHSEIDQILNGTPELLI